VAGTQWAAAAAAAARCGAGACWLFHLKRHCCYCSLWPELCSWYGLARGAAGSQQGQPPVRAGS